MTTLPVVTKHQLRQLARERRMALGDTLRANHSAQIMERLQGELAALSPDDALLTYRAMNSEVDTGALFQQPPCRIFAPRTHSHEHMEWVETHPGTHWHTGIFGIREPAGDRLWHAGPTTILLCPLTAFDRSGNRLGMGKGCFDIWLAGHRPAISRIIGLAFSCQEMESIPAEDHDIPLDIVITEKETIACRTS
ncbi:MAG TPA: 5-formyltetrahydrofolate cyclo-ligase [Mariprofundaceae bacterium]|nr:5-formyltetrahydrofolate cyclo-ligase [Mariprofundaceae bacterium]